jgi:large subunit ribosomal protein L33
MAKAGNRIIFSLECQTCKRRNYSNTKNKRTTPEKVKLKKYCAFCRRHTEHKETK